jgi:hypothetical protein
MTGVNANDTVGVVADKAADKVLGGNGSFPAKKPNFPPAGNVLLGCEGGRLNTVWRRAVPTPDFVGSHAAASRTARFRL